MRLYCAPRGTIYRQCDADTGCESNCVSPETVPFMPHVSVSGMDGNGISGIKKEARRVVVRGAGCVSVSGGLPGEAELPAERGVARLRLHVRVRLRHSMCLPGAPEDFCG